MSEIKIAIPENFTINEASDFRDKINLLIRKGKRDFILDFKICNFIDSTGLGVLVSLYKKCKEVNGTLQISSLNSKVMKVFTLTRLDRVFDIR